MVESFRDIDARLWEQSAAVAEYKARVSRGTSRTAILQRKAKASFEAATRRKQEFASRMKREGEERSRIRAISTLSKFERKKSIAKWQAEKLKKFEVVKPDKFEIKEKEIPIAAVGLYGKIRQAIEAKYETSTRVGIERAEGTKLVTMPFYELGADIGEKIRDVGEYSAQYYREEMPVTGEYLARTAEVSTKAIAGIPEFVGMLPGGVETMIKKPEVIFPALAVGAYGATIGMVKEFKEDPIQVTADVLAFSLIGAGAVKPIPKIKATIGKGIPEVHVGLPTGIFTGKKLTVPEGLKQTQVLKFEAGAKIATTLKGVESPIKKPLDFTTVKSLPEKSGKLVEVWIRENPKQDPVIGGSAAAKVHFKEARAPGDIDLFVKDPVKAGREIHAILSKELGKDKTRLTIDEKWGSAVVEIYNPKEKSWHHAVDIHPSTTPGQIMEFGLTTQRPITIEGIQYVRGGELIQRKAASVLVSRKPGIIGPKPHRTKDIIDFEKLVGEVVKKEKSSLESVKWFKELREKKVKGIEEQLETYKMYSSFGPEVYMEVVKHYGKLPLPVRIAPGLASIAPYSPTEIKDEVSTKVEAYEAGEVPRRLLITPYEPPYKPPYEPPYKPPYESPYKPPYEPPYEPPYKPPYEPMYDTVYEPPYKPPYKDPVVLLPPYERIIKPRTFDIDDEKPKKVKKVKKGKKGYLERLHLIGDPATALMTMGKGYEEFTNIAVRHQKIQKQHRDIDLTYKLSSQFVPDGMFSGVLPTKVKRPKHNKVKRNMFDI